VLQILPGAPTRFIGQGKFLRIYQGLRRAPQPRPGACRAFLAHCGFLALAARSERFIDDRIEPTSWGDTMKKFAVALALVVASLSLAGCFVGKGKAPAPVVTKG